MKTSGSKGLHVYVRLLPQWDGHAVRFVDFNQDAPHKTVFGAWSVRARIGAQVSTPIAWDEVDTVDVDTLTMDVAPGRLAEHGDP